ncbi:MAG: hypothetical protein Q8O62_04385 [Aequorivita sp.]|nr:hypothetical protein [Aequorivita sp.]
MEPTPATILSFLSNLIKPRDYLFFGIPAAGLFIAESINDGIIPFMTIGETAILGGALGIILNKSAMQLLLDKRDKDFTLKASKNYIEYLDELLLNETMLLTHRKIIEGLKASLLSTIAKYDKKIIKYEEFESKFNTLKEIDFDF